MKQIFFMQALGQEMLCLNAKSHFSCKFKVSRNNQVTSNEEYKQENIDFKIKNHQVSCVHEQLKTQFCYSI